MKKDFIASGEKCYPSISELSCINELKDVLKNEKKLGDIIEYSKIMSDKTRGSIIYLLYKKGSLCVCDLANILDMSSQAISSQLIKLYDKGIIKRERKGLSVYYSLSNKTFVSFLHNIL
ncbi:MAG: metalloregulator ArsR/SmtB family transcription factor [Candidatus Gracilibacteria bacterium]|nr:metalloregulator ArsR/SmtB family transcription factor [Candidatus Gracilibacteria bacterium]